MALAGLAPVSGTYTPMPFDGALPLNDTSQADNCASALPAPPDEIRAMQARGRSWLHPGGHKENAALPSSAPEPIEAAPSPESTPKSTPNENPVAPAKPKRQPLRTASNASRPPCRPADRHLQSLMNSCAELTKKIGQSDETRSQYGGALLAVGALSDAILRQQRGDSCDRPALHADTKGGMPICDVDEAGPGMVAAAKYLKNAITDGVGSLGDTLTQEANLWAYDPKSWLTHSAMPHGGADLAIAGVTATALVPFALLALHAGISEMREAKQLGKELTLEIKHSFEFLKTLDRLAKSLKQFTPPQFRRLVEALQNSCAQQLADLMRLQEKNKQNARIGLCSAGSGAAITASTTLGLIGQAAAVPALATAIGAAGTMAVGPAAALFAVGLGANMVATSTEAKKNFKAAAEPLKNRLEGNALEALRRKTAGKHDYLAFLGKKLEQRSHFFKDYAQKNRRFLGGASLYTASSLAGFGLTAAALLGAGVAVGPIGMGALLVAGAVGGLVMARNSTQFLFGHGRMHRYSNDSVGDHHELDRKFQNILDSIGTLSGNARGMDQNTGIALRADIYKHASKREELRQDFLSEVAGKTNTRYHQAYSYSTDSEEVRTKRGGAPTVWSIARAIVRKKADSVIGYSRAGLCYLSTLLRSRSHATAKTEAGKLRQEIKPYLSGGKLRNWLHEEGNHPRQIAFMLDCLKPQIKSLRKMASLQTKLYLYSNSLNVPQQERPSYEVPFEVAGDAQAQQVFLDRLVAPLARNADLLGQMEHLQVELTGYVESANLPPQPLLAQTIMKFLSLQEGKPYDTHAALPDFGESQKAFADHCLNEAAGNYRHLRGMLIDVELQAMRLAQRTAPSINPRSAGETSRLSP